jgi:hypothetical protein
MIRISGKDMIEILEAGRNLLDRHRLRRTEVALR